MPLPDTGERYLSKLYNDEWMRENQLLDADRTTLAFVLEAKARRSGDTPIVVSVAPGATVRQALGLMSLHDVSQLPVMDGANCVGSVSDWSLSAKSLDNTKLLDATVSEVMDPPFPIVDAGAAGGQRGEAAVEIESRGARPLERQRSGNRDSLGHAQLSDGAMSGGPVDRLKIVVLMGGTSSERDVSLASGIRIAEALRSLGHDGHARSIRRAGRSAPRSSARWAPAASCSVAPPSQESLRQMAREALPRLASNLPRRGDADVVFLGLHGGIGEDGTIQAHARADRRTVHGQRHTWRARWRWTRIFPRSCSAQAGVADARTGSWPRRPLPKWGLGIGYPAIVKPSKQGSTVGLSDREGAGRPSGRDRRSVRISTTK